MKQFTITPEELQKSAVKYLPQLLKMPVIAAKETLQHMTPRPGTRGRVVLGEIGGSLQIGPYDASRIDESATTIKGRVLETFLGSVIHEFDPNTVWPTIYGSLTTQGEALKDVNISRELLSYLAAQLGKHLNLAIWDAARDDQGTTTKDLFDGFDTIAAAEITAGNISVAKKNLFEFSDPISSNNAVDLLKACYRAAAPELRGQKVKMYMTYDILDAYQDDYQQTVGAAPYNTRFEKPVLEGSNGLCEFVPLVSKTGSPFITLAPQGNMFYGYGDGLAEEKLAVEKHHALLLQFVATMFFGVQYKSVSPEMLLIGKLATSSDNASSGGAENQGGTENQGGAENQGGTENQGGAENQGGTEGSGTTTTTP